MSWYPPIQSCALAGLRTARAVVAEAKARGLRPRGSGRSSASCSISVARARRARPRRVSRPGSPTPTAGSTSTAPADAATGSGVPSRRRFRPGGEAHSGRQAQLPRTAQRRRQRGVPRSRVPHRVGRCHARPRRARAVAHHRSARRRARDELCQAHQRARLRAAAHRRPGLRRQDGDCDVVAHRPREARRARCVAVRVR